MSSFEGFTLPRRDKRGTLGKQMASGTVVASSATLSFNYVGGSATIRPYVTVTNLTFKPSSIVLFSPGGGNEFLVVYSELPGGLYPKTIKFADSYNSSNLTTASNNIKGDAGAASVTSAGFVLPVHANYASLAFSYIAYE